MYNMLTEMYLLNVPVSALAKLAFTQSTRMNHFSRRLFARESCYTFRVRVSSNLLVHHAFSNSVLL